MEQSAAAGAPSFVRLPRRRTGNDTLSLVKEVNISVLLWLNHSGMMEGIVIRANQL